MAVKTGHGRTVQLSSDRVLFESGDDLPHESTVELSIAWPARLNDTVGLQLWIQGRTVRSQNSCTAVEIERHEFRTQYGSSTRTNGRAHKSLWAFATIT
jgi:hypothetical protein